MALGNVVARLLVKLGIDKKEFDAGAAAAKNEARGLASSLNTVSDASGMMSSAMRSAAELGGAYMAKKAISAVFELGKLGAESLQLTDSFEDLARQAGASGDELLQAMKRAVGGTVSEMDLMLAANKGMLLGLGADTEQWADLIEVARYRARAMGITTTQAVDDITTAIGRESKQIADNLGLIWDMDSVMQNYAQSLGKTKDELTSAGRKQALMTETISIGKAQIEAAGGLTETYADKIAAMDAAIEDAKVALGEGFAPAIAEVAGAIADLTPEVLEAAEALGILERATWEWVVAALAGKDPQAAFELSIAKSVGSSKELAQAALNAAEAELELARAALATADAAVAAELAQENFSAAEYNMASAAQEAAVVRVRAAQEAYNAAIKVAEANGIGIDVHDRWISSVWAAYEAEKELTSELTRLPPAAYAALGAASALADQMMESASAAFTLKDALDDLNSVSVDEIGNKFNAAADRIEDGLASLAGDQSLTLLRGLRNQYIAELTDLYANANDLTEFELEYREQLIMGAFDDELATLRKAADDQAGVLTDMADSYKQLRGTIESALQATTVTALDMGLTNLGEYVDKWDENARRLDAIAARGFAELDAHPDWAGLLKIPENVLAAGEEALKSWASQTADDVRSLFRPDLLNVGAAADAVEAYMREQAAKELSIDLVIGELVARGGMTPEEAQQQVRQAYGLETEPVDIPIKLVSAVAGEEGAGWSAAADELVDGIRQGISDSSLVTEFIGYFRTDITNNEALLNSAGETLWDTVEVGILLRLDRADYATLFVSKLGPLVGTWLLENQNYTQGEGNP